MLASKAKGRTNSIKALNLLHYTVTKNGYTIERTVNVHGRPGKNVSSDLHIEHLNRLCKNTTSCMCASVTGQSIQRSVEVLNARA